ncbi:hypothetical protein ACLOJK_014325 [Asimina triloba]
MFQPVLVGISGVYDMVLSASNFYRDTGKLERSESALKKPMANDSRLQVAIWTVKLAFYSAGIISAAVFLKHAIPCFLAPSLSALPRLWISLRSWLAPPYLYIVVNFIILTIAASSNFHHRFAEKNAQAKAGEVLEKQRDSVDPAPEVDAVEKIPADPEEKAPEKTFSFSGAAVRRRVRASASSKSLGAAPKPKQPDTLDDTWKAITEGRERRQLKKSDTWEAAPRVEAEQEEKGLGRAGGGRDLKKWEAFREAATASASASWVGLRREISLSKEDLNRRVEAFIKKINNEIRMQRQQSYEKSLGSVRTWEA